MPDIALGQTIQGSFTSNDPKINDYLYYDEYNLPNNLTNYNNIRIAFNSGIGNTPGSTTVALINAATNAILAESTYRNISRAVIDQTISPGIQYKIRVANSNLSNGKYSLSLEDEGAATSIFSSGDITNGTNGYQIGAINSIGTYFALAKTGYDLADVALASTGLLYGIIPSKDTYQGDRLFIADPYLGGNQSLNAKDIKDASGNNIFQNFSSLAFSNNDKLYAIGTAETGASGLYQINTSNYVATLLGSLPTGLNNAGDLVYDPANSRFLAVSPTQGLDLLWSIPLANPTMANKIGQTGFTGITGLSFTDGQLIGFSNYGGSIQKIRIDTTTGNSVGVYISSSTSSLSNVTGASTIVYPAAPTPQISLTDLKKDPGKYMGLIRDYDGNNLGGTSSWKLRGEVDIQGDGDLESILVNPAIGRFASVGSVNGNVDFTKYGLNGDTRVVGIYIDPTLKDKPQNIGGPFDSQRRFQNDLRIDNLKVLAAGDYNKDGFQDLYFRLGDGSAVLRAVMFADGNIQYANYQSKADLTAFMTTNNVSSSVWGNWL
jgi:hypothetical protein